MRKLLILIFAVILLAVPVSGQEYTAPEPPQDAKEWMPDTSVSFGKDLWHVVKKAVSALEPEIRDAASVCLAVLCAVMLVSVFQQIPGNMQWVLEFVLTLAIGTALLLRSGTLIRLAAQTVTELSEYGKLLLPVMTGAMAAQGGGTTAAALYTATTAFDAVLGSLISKLLVPVVYMYLALSLAVSATGMDGVGKLRDFLKWLSSWSLKISLYLFTGFLGITGVVSGTTDAAALKVTKLSISGMVPVVGGILSDASEAVLVGAGLVKSGVGIYGMVAMIAIWIAPFLRIGVQYLLLKLTAGVCGTLQFKRATDLVQSFSTAMGLLLGMTGTISVMLLVSTVCFMRGVG